jgi:hypothetical protein
MNGVDGINATIPIDRVAFRVTRPGEGYIPKKIIQTNDSDIPIPTRSKLPHNLENDLSGYRFGRFIVIGFASGGLKGSWVVRCDCGVYSTRKTRAVLNPLNTQDRCEHCRHLAFLKREEAYRRTGKDADINEY